MVDFVDKLELSDQEYHTNVNVRDEHYKGKLLFPMNYFVPFGTDFHSIYFMSIVLLKYKIDGFRVPQFQLAYIFDTTHPSHNNLVKLCCEVNDIWWLN